MQGGIHSYGIDPSRPVDPPAKPLARREREEGEGTRQDRGRDRGGAARDGSEPGEQQLQSPVAGPEEGETGTRVDLSA